MEGRGSCLVRSHLTAIPCFVLGLTALTTKALQPQLAHATRFVARSSPLTKANKKDPSNDESFLLAGDEARTRDILLGKEAFYH